MFNPLDHPVCFSYPRWMTATASVGHVPFAMFLVDLLRPKVVVGLGSFSGVSYCALCQAVKELRLDARCYGVDSPEGGAGSGPLERGVLRDLKLHHDAQYGDFSALIQSTFD